MNHSPKLNRRSCLAFGLAAVGAGVPLFAHAQPKAVRLVLPNAPGSGVDAIARAAQPALSKALDASVIVENQPGAGGIVGLQTLARSAPDGGTFSMVSNNVVIFPSVMKSLSFDMPGDFTPIAVIGAAPVVLVVNPKRVAARNNREFVELLRSKPGQLNFGSGGPGTILHVSTELYLQAAGVTATHVPYKGVGPMVTDLMAGQIDFASAALSSVHGQIKSGSLCAIGMMTPQRTPAAPDVPTFAEQGLKNFSVEAWIAVIGPKGLAAAQVNKMHAALVATFNDPAVKDAMEKQGNSISVSTTEVAQATFRSELARYAAVVKKVGLQPSDLAHGSLRAVTSSWQSGKGAFRNIGPATPTPTQNPAATTASPTWVQPTDSFPICPPSAAASAFTSRASRRWCNCPSCSGSSTARTA
jgi:tripartite-type tricarboxylate transporter receptor subunit TctC